MFAQVDGLIESTQAMLGGDTDRAEAVLFCQANTLHAICTEMVLRAAQNPYSRDFETYMRISLKAKN